jgi:hypothetical protein
MKAIPYIQAIEDCIVLLNEILDDYDLEEIDDRNLELEAKLNRMLTRLNDLKVEYHFQKDTKIDLEKKE